MSNYICPDDFDIKAAEEFLLEYFFGTEVGNIIFPPVPTHDVKQTDFERLTGPESRMYRDKVIKEILEKNNDPTLVVGGAKVNPKSIVVKTLTKSEIDKINMEKRRLFSQKIKEKNKRLIAFLIYLTEKLKKHK